MKRLTNYFILQFAMLIFHGVYAQSDRVTITPLYYENALDNPLKGFRGSPGDTYDGITRTYLKWNELERNENDGVDQIISVCNKKWNSLANNNCKVIPRVYLDWDSKTGNEYWPSDMQEGDYSSTEFKKRVEKLIEKLGIAWNNDPRVAWIQMGIIGYWGEQHHPSPNGMQQQLLGDAFTKAFPNKKVLVRRPWEIFTEYPFGWYWDSFAHIDQISSQAAPMMANCPDRWKIAPIEGETAYNWGNYKTQPGENPNETLSDPNHRDWLIDWIRKTHCTGLGWVASYNQNDAQVRAGANEVQKAFGYRFVIKEVNYPGTIKNDQPFSVTFDVENTGSAPFYYQWPLELRLLDATSKQVKWRRVFQTVDIRDWMPGDNWDMEKNRYTIPAPVIENEGYFRIGKALPKGKYILALAILDPAGMEPSVRFATSQYLKGGLHPLGYIGIDTTLAGYTIDSSVFDDPGSDNSLIYKDQRTLQTSFENKNGKIPGTIEAENYDEGGEGVAYHDNFSKEGDLTIRAGDRVDVFTNSMAGNDTVVGATNDGEWLEYTVDVEAGKYDVSLYYFCRETPGELLVSLNGRVLGTMCGLQKNGWETLDSVQLNDIFLETTSNNNILRLTFINGAGFDMDAIRFTKKNTPVSGLSLSDCPSDTLYFGQKIQLSTFVSPYYADNRKVQWESSDETVARVDETGLVNTLSEGVAIISARTVDGDYQQNCEINVIKRLYPVYGVTIGDCPGNILTSGETVQLLANVAPENADNKLVSWGSSNPEVAEVDENGLLTALSQGTTKITVQTDDGSYTSTCSLGVREVSTANHQINLSAKGIGKIFIYPNPASATLCINFSDSGIENSIFIYNAFGRLLMSKTTFQNHIVLDISSFSAERYVLVNALSGKGAGTSKLIAIV